MYRTYSLQKIDISYYYAILKRGDSMIEITSVRHTYPERAGFRIDRRNGHPDYTFLHFHNSVEIVKNGQTICTKPHAVLLYAPGTTQYFCSEEPLVHDWFHFRGGIGELTLEHMKMDEILYPGIHSFITKIVAQMEMEFFGSKNNREVYLELLTKELLIKLDRAVGEEEKGGISPETKERLRDLRGEMFSSLHRGWTVSDMARQVNFSQSRFYSLYREVFGISPTADLIHARMNAAKNMLLFETKKIEDIAQELGYQNVTHFNRQFKVMVGSTPGEYRKGGR